jgi:hypothetical protein
MKQRILKGKKSTMKMMSNDDGTKESEIKS